MFNRVLTTFSLLILHFFFLSNISAQEKQPSIFDVAVIGGGVSGTYCAWRLSEETEKKISLMELSDRIGGKLYSISLPEFPSAYAEFGGMRICDHDHNALGLVNHLALKTAPFQMGSDNNIFFLRNVRYTNGNIIKEQTSYNLRKNERHKTDGELLTQAILQAFPSIKDMSIDQIVEYLKTATFKGQPIWKWGFWNFLIYQLGMEGYLFIDDAYGYLSEMSNWNAYDAIIDIWIDLQTKSYVKLIDGFDSLPKKMAELFVKNGGTLSMKSRVVSLKQVRINGENLIQIFYRYSEHDTQSIYARNVILAMPRRSIEMLDKESFIFEHQRFKEDLVRVTPQPASKVFMWYDDEWWTKLGLYAGAAHTDLPIRQCYYFNTEDNSKKGNGNNLKKGLLMASYNDGVAVEFWDGYFEKSALDYFNSQFYNEDYFLKIRRLPSLMTNEITEELKLVHGIDIPAPSAAFFVNWTADPFGGGWHFWNPHNQSWVITPRMRHPIENANLYICGEAYSARQSWVESAINSAELVLQEYFSLPKASWISPEYNLGP